MIVNDDSRVINKLEASLTDNARVVIYDRHMFIVQATGQGYTCLPIIRLAGTVVEHSTHNPNVKGSNPATCTGREKLAKSATQYYLLQLEGRAKYYQE